MAKSNEQSPADAHEASALTPPSPAEQPSAQHRPAEQPLDAKFPNETATTTLLTEYQLVMEELQTGREELARTNIALHQANNELADKLVAVRRAHSDLENLMAATEGGTLFLDRHLCITRFTNGATKIFDIAAADIGRPLTDLRHHLHYHRLVTHAQQVLTQGTPVEDEVTGAAHEWYLLRMRPYVQAGVVDGVVITFINITERRRAQEALMDAKTYAEKIVNTVREALVVLTPDLRIKSASQSFYQRFKLKPTEVEGKLIYELGNGQWNIPRLRTLLEEVLPANELFNDFEVTLHFDRIGTRKMILNARRLDHVQLILLAIEDVTTRNEALTALRQLNETLEERVAQRTEQVRALASTLTMAEHQERQRISHVLHDDLQQLLYGIQMRMMMCIESLAHNDLQQLPIIAQEVYDWLGEAIQTTRHLTVDLSPPVLEGEGLVEAIGWLITQMAEVYRLKVDLQATVDVPVPDKEMRLLLFQIVRELLFNVFKHAGTDRATIEIEQGATNTLIIRVIDEGVGFDVAAAEARYDGGFGLFSVRERLRLFGGQMMIDAAPGMGTQIAIYTPAVYTA